MLELPNRSTNHVLSMGTQLQKMMNALPKGITGFEMKIDPKHHKMVLSSRGLKGTPITKKVELGRLPKTAKRFSVGLFSIAQMVSLADNFIAVAREAKASTGANIAIRFEPRRVTPRVVAPRVAVPLAVV